MSLDYSEERKKLLEDIDAKLSADDYIEKEILRDAKTQIEKFKNLKSPEILRFSCNGKPYHIEILPSREWRVVLANTRKNPVLATSNKDKSARWIKHDVLTANLQMLHEIIKDITHPCLTKNIYLPSWIVENNNFKRSHDVCIEDLDDNDIKYETMPKIEKIGKILTAKQFLLIAFSLTSLLKTLHENNIVLGEIDADAIQLKRVGNYYFPILQKHNLTSLKKSNSDDDKKNDMKRLCKMLLGMSHHDDKKTENDPNSINAWLIKNFKKIENSTDTLFNDLSRKVIITNDENFINNALDAAGINKAELNEIKEDIFFKNISDEKLNAQMLLAYYENNTEKIEALKFAYKDRPSAFTKDFFEQNPQCASDIAFAFWEPNNSNNLFTKFINSHILVDNAIDEKLARHILQWHGVSTGDGKYLSTQVARNIINQRKGIGYVLQDTRHGLLQIIRAIEAYESVLIRREKEELPLHYFRCHKTSERRGLCREILQNCSEAKDTNDLCNKLQSCINKLNKFSTLGKSKLAEKLETIQNDLNPKLKKTYFRLF